VLLIFSDSIFSFRTIAKDLDNIGNKYFKKRKNHGLV